MVLSVLAGHNRLYTGQLWDGKVHDEGTGLYFYNPATTTPPSTFYRETKVNLHRFSSYADCSASAGACVLPARYEHPLNGQGYAIKDILILDRLFLSADSWQSPIFGKGQVVHELAHVIDFNTGYSNLFPQMGHQTSYQLGNTAAEYWAEAVAVWVYPTYGISEVTGAFIGPSDDPWRIGNLHSKQYLFFLQNLRR